MTTSSSTHLMHKASIYSQAEEMVDVQIDFPKEAPTPRLESSFLESPEKTSPVGSLFLKNIWYYALPAEKLKDGKMLSKVMLGEPILLGRDRWGNPFALKDICPHQGIPLSEGTFDGIEIECCFHGWCFDTDGICTAIPSLLPEQKVNICRIKTQAYPCHEIQGSIWVYFGDQTDNLPEVPVAPGLDNCSYDKTTTTLILPTHIDYAVAALIDTAHVPYVHKSWWWRSRRFTYEKSKTYVPSGTGWTMVKHSPSKNALIFKLLGKFIETEISFCLPGCRREYLVFNDRTILSGITALTPIDETHTELTHSTYWTVPGIAPLVRPIINYFVHSFLGQDQDIAVKQQVGLAYKPNLIMTIKDAGTPGAWYFQLKREWTDACEQGRPFVNPIKEKILRWRT